MGIVTGLLALQVAELKGTIRQMERTPILRQYVEKYVQTEHTAEMDKKVQKQMLEREKEFSKLYGFETKKLYREPEITRDETELV